MVDITEIAIASWRLEKWLNNVSVERKMAAKSALRSINKFLQENNVEVLDIVGTKFDSGLAVSVVNNESDEKDEEKLVIIEMVKPIILQNGSVVQYGQVVLGDRVKEEKPNESVPIKAEETESKILNAQEVNNIGENSSNSEKNKNSKWIVVIFGVSQMLVIALVIYCICSIGSLKQYFPINIDVPEQKEFSIPDYSDELNSIKERIDEIEKNQETESESIICIETDLKNISTKLDEIQKPTIPEKEVYTVKEGDTISKICEKYGYTYETFGKALIEENSIDDPNRIYVGQELIIPSK